MPRLRALNSRTLARLDEHLRFEPPEAARRQLQRVEALVIELLDDAAGKRAQPVYPEAWIEFRVTGLRVRSERDAPGGSGKGPPTPGEGVPLETLLGDLSALCQRLSKRGEVRAEACPPPEWLSAAEVRTRWTVSDKSVERAMSRGLAARRVRIESAGGAAPSRGGRGGRERLAFSRAVVEAFERAFGRPESTGPRMSEQEAERAVRWARGYARRLGWSLDAAAGRIAQRLGRSRQGVRRVLEKHLSGASAGRDGQANGTTAAKARRERLQRLARLRGLDLEAPGGAALASAEAVVAVLAPEGVRRGLAPASPATLGQILAEADVTAMAAREERALAAAAAALLHRARETITRIDRLHPSAALLDVAETDLRWAGRLRAVLIRAQLGLVARTLRGAGDGVGVDPRGLPPRLALAASIAGVRALVGATSVFDPFKGGRLAAPASLAVGRAVGAVMRGEAATGTPGAVIAGETRGRALARSASVDLGAPAWDGFAGAWHAAVDVDAVGAERLRLLDEPARALVIARLGLDGAPPVTIDAAAAAAGVSVQKARSIERTARRRSGVRW